MPIYEYRCLDCQKRSSVLQLSLSNPKPATCAHCRSSRMERLLSRFASPKSEEARLESFGDSDSLDESDPGNMSHLMKKMGNEMGQDFTDDMAEAMDTPEEDAADLSGSDSL